MARKEYESLSKYESVSKCESESKPSQSLCESSCESLCESSCESSSKSLRESSCKSSCKSSCGFSLRNRLRGLRPHFEKTLTMLRFIFRRERIISSIWLVSVVLFTLAILPMQAESYKGQASGDVFNNPVIAGITGPIFGDSIASKISAEMLLFTIIMIAIMNIFLVIRHTRKDEELNRTEVLRSLPIGKLSTLFATFIFSCILNLAIGLLIFGGIAVSGIEGVTAGGALVYGLALSVSGIFFAGLSCLVCQLYQNARTTANTLFLAFGVMYLMRAVGDVGTLSGNKLQESLSYISPLGLILRVEAFSGNRAFPLIIIAIISCVLFLVALKLNTMRDLEQGILVAKRGKDRGGKMLANSFMQVLKLCKNQLIIWSSSMLVLGLVYGSIMDSVEGMIAESEYMQQILGGAGMEAFLSMIVVVSVLMAVIPVISCMTRLSGEESEGRIEPILATPTMRTRLFCNYLIIATVSAVVMLLLTFIGLCFGAYLVLETPLNFFRLFKYTIVYLPAMLALLGIASIMVGFLPKKTYFLWIYLGVCYIILFFGNALRLPSWADYITPIGFIPDLVTQSFDLVAGVKCGFLVAVFVGLTILGLIGYNRRDIKSN